MASSATNARTVVVPESLARPLDALVSARKFATFNDAACAMIERGLMQTASPRPVPSGGGAGSRPPDSGPQLSAPGMPPESGPRPGMA
ncbi:MAG: hypothetical protein ACYDDF_12680 [Thermoplasmatota archaeon]